MNDQITECQCRALWAKVLLQAKEDLLKNNRQEIQNWLINNKIEVGSFLWICQILNLNATKIKQKMLIERKD